MNEIRICGIDSDRVVLEAIMEGVNGLIRAKNEESAPSASDNSRYATAQQAWVEYREFIAKNEFDGDFTQWCKLRLNS